MTWVVLLCVAVGVAAGFAALILGRATYDPMAEPTHTEHDIQAAHLVRAADIDTVHFDTALRGYRMDQVDEVLDALQARLAAYEAGDMPTMKLTRVSARRTSSGELPVPGARRTPRSLDPSGPAEGPSREAESAPGRKSEPEPVAAAPEADGEGPEGHPS